MATGINHRIKLVVGFVRAAARRGDLDYQDTVAISLGRH